MAVNPSWGLLQPVDIGGGFQQSFQQGRQQRAQAETQNALARLAQDPNADINDLAKYNPQLLMQVNQQRQKAQQARTTGDALTGNPQARDQVAYFDPEMYLKLQGNERTQAKEGLTGISQVLQWADTPEKFDAVVRQMSTADPSYQQYLGRFGEREAILAQAGDLVKAMTPDIGFVPADSLAYGKNAAGSAVLGATGQPTSQTTQTVDKATGQRIITGWKQAGYATRDQIEVIKASMGGNQQAVDQYIQNQGLAVVDAVQTGPDGREYYLINGKVYDNPRGQ